MRDTYYLGFDSDCSYCTGIAETVRVEAQSQLEIVPLDSDQMMTWRTDRYGDDPPWSPTLVRTRGDSFDVWTGWQIAPVLGRHLGSTRSVAIITALGADNLNAKSSGGSVGKLSRRHALWTGVGIAAGALMLNGNPAAASEGFRLRLRKRKEVSVVSSRNLSPQETQAQYVDLLKSSDIQKRLGRL